MTSVWDASWQQAEIGTDWLEQRNLEHWIDEQKVDFIRSYVGDGPLEKVCEFGCGSARLAARAALTFGGDVVGVDNSSEALKLSQQTVEAVGLKGTFHAEDVRQSTVPADSIDLVLSGGLLEHFEDPAPVLQEMARVLKPGGLLYADVVPRKWSLFRWKDWGRMKKSAYMSNGAFESDYLDDVYCRIYEDLGLVDMRCEWMGVYPRWVRYPQLKVFSRLDRGRLARWAGWYFMIAARKPS